MKSLMVSIHKDYSLFNCPLLFVIKPTQYQCLWLIGKHAVGSGGAETLENEDNGTFPGLIPLVQEYLRNIDIDTDTMCTLSRYFKVS